MDLQDRMIRRFRRHLAARLVLKHALPLTTTWAFVWGITVLVLRAATDIERLPLLWGLAGMAICVIAAVVQTRRRLPAEAAVRALLDEQSRCGGLLMAGGEQELGAWRQKVPPLRLPRIRWESRRAGSLLAIATGFVVLCFLAPQGLADLNSSPPLDIEQEVAHLVQQIALLKGESIVDPERAELLTSKLFEMREHASGKDPARTLEAMDHMRDLAVRLAREAAEQCITRNERLGEAEALAEVLRQSADLLDSKLKMETLAALAGALDRKGFDPKEFTKLLDPELLESLRQQKLAPDQLARLAESLRDSKTELGRQVEKLHKLGLIDAELLSKCQKAGDCDNEALQAFLKANKGKASVADLKALCKAGNLGSTLRGPGAAPLTWTRPGSQKETAFREEVLPPGAVNSLKSNPSLLPATRSVPLVVHDRSDDPASSGALTGAAAGGGSANTEVILPRHRAAVERYFERKAEIRIPNSEGSRKND
jgi:hypothetical protein